MGVNTWIYFMKLQYRFGSQNRDGLGKSVANPGPGTYNTISRVKWKV